MLATEVVPPYAPPPGEPRTVPLTVYDMPSIWACSSTDAGADMDLQLHIDTGTSPSLIDSGQLDALWDTNAGLLFQQRYLEEPLTFTSMGGKVVSWRFIILHVRIGCGLYEIRFFVVDGLPVGAILGNGEVIQRGIRFNHHRRMLRLRLPPSTLAPGFSQPVNSKGDLMSCQWVPMHYDVRAYSLWCE